MDAHRKGHREMANGSPTVRRRRLGLLLRQFRGDAKLTGGDVAKELQRSESWVSRIEAGHTGVRLAELRALLDFYGVTDRDVRTEMEDLAKHGRERGWWSRYASVLSSDYAAYIGFEAEASRLMIYESLIVHGLLQTEGYARAVFRAGAPTAPAEAVDRRVQVRMRRQELLTREPEPLELWAIFDEAVLRRIIGGDVATHVAQLDRLLDVAREVPTVRVQVIPFAESSHPGMLPSFTMLEFPRDPMIVYIEGLSRDIYEEAEAAKRFILVYEDLRAAALSEFRSIELIDRIRSEVAG